MIDSLKLLEVVRGNIETLCRHFFPNGKKVNGEWKLGDSSGTEGSSLGLCLSTDKAGAWVDRATGDKGNFTQLLMRSRNLTFPGAANEIGRFLGVDLSTHTHHQPNEINWDRCERLASEHVNRMAIWRGLSEQFVKWLSEHDLLRVYGNNGSERWVFPVHMNGKVSGCHSRPVEWAGPDRCPWLILPEKKKGGPGVQPLMIGDLANARSVHVFESQWDMLAVCDRLNLHETNGAAAFCTRGSANGGLVSTMPDAVSEVFLWQQNDDAGTKWTDAIIRKLPLSATARLVKTPSEFEDPNAWTLKGKATADVLFTAISAAVPPNSQHAGEEDTEQKIFDELLRNYSAAVRTSGELETVSLPPRKKLLGQWLYEGDLGFVYGERGSGKTWFVDAVATYLSIGMELHGWKVPEAADVLLVDGEMPIDAARDRLKGMRQGNGRLHLLHHDMLFNVAGLAMNLTSELTQKVITAICVDKKIKLLILDNLSCLFSGVKENDADEWEKVLRWLLDLRRRRIAVLIVHHAGVSGRMRGTTRREDAAFWVIQVDELKNRQENETGASFHTIFTKQRNSDLREWAREWTFKTAPDGQISIGCNEISFDAKVLGLIEDGLSSATDIATELGVHKSTVCRAAQRLVDANLIELNRKAYRPRGFTK